MKVVKKKDLASQWLYWASIFSVFLAAVGATGQDIYLASTQWMLVAVYMAVSAVYFSR